jgi:hypothetical protein
MNRLLSHDLWTAISRLGKNAVKRAAIAYVSNDARLQFSDGDLLICDASILAIKTGQTSAHVLKRAHDRGASVMSLPGLHAKVILLNDKAVIGSANMSESSATDLIEASLLTDQPAIVAIAQSFVNQLSARAEELDEKKLERLLTIKVVKRVPRYRTATVQPKLVARHHRTWVVGTKELAKEFPKEQEAVEEAVAKCRDKLTNRRSTVSHIRWTGRSRFRELCRKDDWLIQMWRPHGAKTPYLVYERMPILDRLEQDGATYILYEEFPRSESRAKSWTQFKRLVLRAGIERKLAANSQFEISESQADSLHALWKMR